MDVRATASSQTLPEIAMDPTQPTFKLGGAVNPRPLHPSTGPRLRLSAAAFVAGTLSLLAADTGPLPPAVSTAVDFARDIGPLLDSRCVQCHGPKRAESGLRLDSRDGALKGGEHGPALVVGRSAESVLVQAVAGVHAELARMPKKGDRLTPDEIGRLRAWIDRGAEWPVATGSKPSNLDHWAWKAPVRPELPKTRDGRWAKSPIDRFLLAKLESEKLRPSPEADRITLLRRLHFDLTGLPPTPEEADRFAADTSPGAWTRKVEELLASPHFGERWGRHWLDAARYADSDGFEKDKPRFVWAYRDWVVNALNRDLPYDRFVQEQVAGDLMPGATEDQRVATGFLRNAMLNEEGGADPEQFRIDGLIDRMDCLGKAVLGVTIQCAQCHNHKFDPVSQEEYYRLFAFLNNDHESSVVAYTPSEQQLRDTLARQMREVDEGLRHVTPGWEEKLAAWEESVRNDQPEWSVVRCNYDGENGERFYYYEDGSIRAASYAPTLWAAHFHGTNTLSSIAAFRLEQLTDPNLPCGGPGRSIRGMSGLTEFKVVAEDLANPTNRVTVKFVRATADFENAEKPLEAEFDDHSGRKRTYGPVAHAIDGKDDTAWGIDAGPGRRNQPRKAVFVAETPVAFPNGARLKFELVQRHGGANSDDLQTHNLGRFRFSATSATNAVADPLPAHVRDIVTRVPRDQRTPAQTAAVFAYWRSKRAEFKEANDRIEALWKQWPEGAPTLVFARRTGDGPGQSRQPTRMFKRGDWLKPGKEVTFGTPAVLHPLPADADDSRLTLARWLTDPRSPTTARVAVNRIWQQYFGTGIVETPEDLGTQSPRPSHAELLDWLAVELMQPSEPGVAPWSLKHIHRLILNSAAYRQSSRVTPALYEKDPYNRLLARGPRFRVEGEIVRDVALAVSGLLNPALGGRPVYPPAPEFLFQPPASYGPKTWLPETGPERYRRSLYAFRFRSVPYPVLQTFDAPNGDASCVRRLRSNTPLQALTSLNEPQFIEAAQALARKTVTEGGKTDEQRIRYAFRRVLSRQPSTRERQVLLDLLAKQRARVSEGWVNAAELATGKGATPSDLPDGVTPTTLAAYTAVSRALLNLDEAITKE
jgi:mono/diheme cytochrome c family protein